MTQNFGTPMIDSTKDAREALRLALGLGSDIPFADYVNHIPSQWTPAEIFSNGQMGFWYEPNDIGTLFQDASGLTPVTANNDPIGKVLDKSGNNNHGVQSISSRRMTYKVSPPRFFSDRVDDALVINIPAEGWAGTMVIATNVGTASYGVSIPAGSYNLGDRFFPKGEVIGVLFRQGGLTKDESLAVEEYFIRKGAVESYINEQDLASFWLFFEVLVEMPLIDLSGATNLYNAWGRCSITSFPLVDTSNVVSFMNSWSNCQSLTTFPLINTSSGTNFSSAWISCDSLLEFPLIDTSKGIDFRYAWRLCRKLDNFPALDMSSGTSFTWGWYGCNSLTNFPPNVFDNVKGGDFNGAFTATNLSQESIDGILTSLVTSGISTGTRVFGQSGGSAPSAVGQAAIDTLRARGWTVTVTGGY